MSSLLVSPHDDDSVLFASFTCIREKPVVVIVTDSHIQPKRGEIGCDAETRAHETENACEVLGCPIVRLGIPDDTVTEEEVFATLGCFSNFDTVYAPALQGGNPHHDLVSRACKARFGSRTRFYPTYTRTELYTTGIHEVTPTDEEMNLKLKAMECYKSQINLPSTLPHFQAVLNKPEWLF